MTELHDRCAALIQELGIGSADEVTRVVPLSGGVASDIARVDVSGRSYAVKFALPKLKVAADWRAPVHRNAAEYAWLQFAANVRPAGAVALFGRSDAQHGFVMEFLSGDDAYLWKSALLAGHPDKGEAAAVGDQLGAIHAASVQDGFDPTPFRNRDDFRSLRIEPYLDYTAEKWPELAGNFRDLADMLYRGDSVLVHGDVSPKNILFRSSGPVILDAECATMGDASFDPSFCLNHLVLKAVHLPAWRHDLLGAVEAFWGAYSPHVDWEPRDDLQARVCRLLPALMLARVDGKSPVEYLSAQDRDFVRNTASDLLVRPAATLSEFVQKLHIKLREENQ